MTTPNLPMIILPRKAWNSGRIIGQKRPLQPKHVWAKEVGFRCTATNCTLASERKWPVFNDPLRLIQAGEPIQVQTFLPEAPVETFDIGVLGWLDWIDEVKFNTVIINPAIQCSPA